MAEEISKFNMPQESRNKYGAVPDDDDTFAVDLARAVDTGKLPSGMAVPQREETVDEDV